MIPSQLTVLLEATLRALIAALAVWAGMRLLRVRNVLAQKAAWGLVLVAALAMPFLMRWQWVPAWASVNLPTASLATMAAPAPFSAPAPATSVSPSGMPKSMAQPVPEAQDRFSAPTVPDDEPNAPPITEREDAPISAPVARNLVTQTTAVSATGRLLAITWILYLGVCAALLLRLLWGLVSSLRLWDEAIAVEAASDFDLPDSIPVRSSPRISSPVNIGSGILLPADYAEWDEEKLRVVVAHERSHIRQRDFYLQILAGLYTSLTWFSPLGWWLKRKLSELSEAISDRAGLDAAKSPSAYAQLLLEFAALPRPTVTGVAMAHSKNLSHRIERLLNESSFRVAFAGGRRALLALLLPVALIVATAMVRVEAAATPKQADSSPAVKLAQEQPPSQSAVMGQSRPLPAQVSDSGSGQAPPAPSAPEAAPAPAAPGSNPAPQTAPAPADSQESSPEIPAIPPIPPIDLHVQIPPIPPIDVNVQIPPIPPIPAIHMFPNGAQGPCMGNGDPYAIVGDPGSQTRFCGNWGPDGAAEVDKARSVAHGHFLLFRHDGKYYVVDDPATVSQIEEMHNEVEQQAEQMRALGQQLRDADRQARDAARKAREAAANTPTPDLSKEIAALEASVASLEEKQGGTISREPLQELQRKISELQREISAMQRRVTEAEDRADLDRNMNDVMGQFGAEQGKFSEQMGKLGAEMGRMSIESNKKIGQIMDESLKNGKARPVN